MPNYFSPLPPRVHRLVAELAADVIERAADIGERRWGATPYASGFRVNVGWTEILTANPDHLRLIIDGTAARDVRLGRAGIVSHGEDDRGFYPSVPGSVLVELDYTPVETFRAAISQLRPALMSAVDIAGRRRSGRGVQEGHRQQLVADIGRMADRSLPEPESKLRAPASEGAALMEGALSRVVRSQYERSDAARRACIDHHGCVCSVCRFSFEDVYGPVGRGFIHVHHLETIASRKKLYEVDPVHDLIPVCPNCHAMLHRDDPPITPEQLRRLIVRPDGG